MRINEVQSTVSALIAATPALAAFGAVLVEDGVTDLEPTILAALETHGVCIALADLAGTDRDQASKGARAIGNSILTVFVFEAPAHSHSPSGLALIDAVVTCISANEYLQFNSFDRGANEKGGTCTAIDFTARVMLGA